MNQCKSQKADRLIIVVSLLLLIVFTAGCAVLTPAQVREVNKFATAAHSYGPLPGAVIEVHSDIRQTQKVLEATTFKDGENSLKQLKAAILSAEEFRKRSRKADQALDVLTNYADMLVKLTSDEYTNEIQASAENLGEVVDKGITKYNKENGTGFSLFGGTTAAIVRGVGGTYIRHKQAKALKHAITEADPAIDNMITAVEELLVLYLNNEDLKKMKINKIGNKDPATLDLIRFAREDLEASYKNTVETHEGKLPYYTASIVMGELVAVDDALQLARDALRAARAYRDAHVKLSQVVMKKQSLESIIDEVQVLSDEVNEAWKLKKALDRR